MASPTSVNPQITDAARARTHAALADALVGLSQSAAVAYQNAVNAQQQASTIAQATTTQGISTLYGIDTSSTGQATKETP
jgi:hypothetical protein